MEKLDKGEDTMIIFTRRQFGRSILTSLRIINLADLVEIYYRGRGACTSMTRIAATRCIVSWGCTRHREADDVTGNLHTLREGTIPKRAWPVYRWWAKLLAESSTSRDWGLRFKLRLRLMPRDTFRLKFGEIARGTIRVTRGDSSQYSEILSGWEKKVKLRGIISILYLEIKVKIVFL